ncbi:MAG TPA: hypothetical protein PKD56_14945, partial [Chitinophagales bacterium]|nr:hypothetical protein [Chitinophagales bacterium]
QQRESAIQQRDATLNQRNATISERENEIKRSKEELERRRSEVDKTVATAAAETAQLDKRRTARHPTTRNRTNAGRCKCT